MSVAEVKGFDPGTGRISVSVAWLCANGTAIASEATIIVPNRAIFFRCFLIVN